MNIYKFKSLDNGDILLEKFILDNDKFTIINKSNGDILLKKIINISNIDNIKYHDFKNQIYYHV